MYTFDPKTSRLIPKVEGLTPQGEGLTTPPPAPLTPESLSKAVGDALEQQADADRARAAEFERRARLPIAARTVEDLRNLAAGTVTQRQLSEERPKIEARRAELRRAR
jgi:hypothetical protein